MRYLLSVLIILLVSCASKMTSVKSPMPLNENGEPLDVSVALIGERLGHGCPANGFIYTAKHLLKSSNPLDGNLTGVFTWSDRDGNNGRATLWAADSARDLAILRIETGRPSLTLNLAKSITPGERLHWFQYDWSSRQHAMEPELKWARVLGLNIAQYIRMDEEPIPGASGGCVLNDAGDVVGIVVWGIQLENRQVLGMAVSLIEDPEVHDLP